MGHKPTGPRGFIPQISTKKVFLVGAVSLGMVATASSSGQALASSNHAGTRLTTSAALASSTGIPTGGTLVAATGGGGPWSPVFNPFSPSYNYAFGFGAIYEPLFVTNPAGGLSPWLATHYNWGNGGRQLVITVRKGVKWSNGKPLTAGDVAFTFRLQKTLSTENGTTSQLLSANAKGQLVTLNFTTPQYVNLDGLALNTPIVPPFTFGNVSNPLKFEDSHPIGTGPFELESWSPQYIIYKRNPHYWVPGEPHITKVEDIAADSNSTMEAELIAHKVSLSGVFTSDLFKTFVNRDPSRNLVFTPPSGVVVLAPNLTDPVFKSLALRQAINLTLNRENLDKIGESGAEPPASQSGLAGQLTAPYIMSQYRKALTPDLAKAKSVLTAAGYKLAGGKLTAPNSSAQVGFSIEFPSTYSDWLTDCSLIKSDLTAIGVNVTCDGVSYQTWSSDEGSGNFQSTFYISSGAGPTAYEEYYNFFTVPKTGLPAVGKPNGYENIEYYDNPSAVAALARIEKINPKDNAAVRAQLDIIQNILVKQVPVIPLFDSTYHEDFVNGPLYGWPSTHNAYNCTCNSYWEPVLLHAHEK